MWDSEIKVSCVLNLDNTGGQWPALRLKAFKSGERVPGTHCMKGCVGLRGDLDAVAKRKDPTSGRNETAVA
jgi:hypothetical protein